jgi:hypothetical protein
VGTDADTLRSVSARVQDAIGPDVSDDAVSG